MLRSRLSTFEFEIFSSIPIAFKQANHKPGWHRNVLSAIWSGLLDGFIWWRALSATNTGLVRPISLGAKRDPTSWEYSIWERKYLHMKMRQSMTPLNQSMRVWKDSFSPEMGLPSSTPSKNMRSCIHPNAFLQGYVNYAGLHRIEPLCQVQRK